METIYFWFDLTKENMILFRDINQRLLNLLICLCNIKPLNWLIYCCISCAIQLSTHQYDYFRSSKTTSNFGAMRFCTANLIQSINLPIQILIVHQIEMDIEEEIAVAYLLIRRMRKKWEKKEGRKTSWSDDFF